MATIHVTTKKLADLDAAIPGLAKVWRQIKDDIGSKIRCPKRLTVRDEAAEMYLIDGECGRRYALDLANMTLGGYLPVSSGEWRCHAGPLHEERIEGVPNAAAVVEVSWHEYYRAAYLSIQVASGAIPAQLSA